MLYYKHYLLLIGSHTFEAIADVINEEMERFDIADKVVCIVTDNGPNVVKAVQSMQDDAKEQENAKRLKRLQKSKEKRDQKKAENLAKKAAKAKAKADKRTNSSSASKESNKSGNQAAGKSSTVSASSTPSNHHVMLELVIDDLTGCECVEEETEALYIELDLDGSVFDQEISVSDILATAIVEETDAAGRSFLVNRSTLKEDIPCSSHTLNLVATVDFNKVLESIKPVSLKKKFESASEKVKSLWNLSKRSIKASDFIYEKLSKFKRRNYS